MIRLFVTALLVFCSSPLHSIAGGGGFKSHPPQRPLPQPFKERLRTKHAFFVDSTRGNDKNAGTLNKPWKTIQHSVRRLQPGQTLYIRGGVYHERVYLTQDGQADRPIVISAYPGELPILDGGIPEFLHSPATSWQPLKGGAPGEYVSTRTYTSADSRRVPNQFLPGSWEPMFGKERHRPLALGHFADSMVPLHGYRTREDLLAANELSPASKNVGAVYCGPGLWLNRSTGRIHCRLAHHRLPGLGARAYRGETDPRKLKLIVAAGFGDDVLRINGIQHVRIKGLVLRGATGSPLLHVYGSQHIHLDHLTVYGGFPGLLVNASQNVQVTHSAFRGLAAPWSGRSHMKYRGTPSYQIVLQNAQPYNENIELSHCEFTDDHDFAFLRYARNLQFHHNYVDNFNDDGLECGAKLGWHSVYIHQNFIGACLGVLQQHEIAPDESPTTHVKGSGLYIYRNVFDPRAGVYYGLPRKPDPSGKFLRHEGQFLSDHGSPVYPVMRIYHNTFVRRTPAWRNYFLFGLATRALRKTEREIFNNLFVQENGIPGAVVYGKKAGQLREGGNILWSVNQGATVKNPFARLRRSTLFDHSKLVYAPGWTTLDRFADPRFVRLAPSSAQCDLRLSTGSPAINTGVELSASYPDPLRTADSGKPDIGAIPHQTKAWNVGVDGRFTIFGGRVR